MSSEDKLEKLIAALENEKVQDSLLRIVERLDVVRDLVETLFEFKRSGILDDLVNLAASVRFFTEGVLSKDFIERLSRLQEVALIAGTNLSMDPSKVDCITYALASANEVRPVGLMGLLSALRDPEVQRGLGLLVAILKRLGACPSVQQ